MTIQISGNNPVKFKNDVSIEGNLQVNGNIINADGEDMIPHLYELIFNVGDDYVSFLTTEQFIDYKIEDTSNLTQNDCDYLNNFKDKNINVVANNGSISFYNITPQITGVFTNNSFALKLDGSEFSFDVGNLQSGASIGNDAVEINIIVKKII